MKGVKKNGYFEDHQLSAERASLFDSSCPAQNTENNKDCLIGA